MAKRKKPTNDEYRYFLLVRVLEDMQGGHVSPVTINALVALVQRDFVYDRFHRALSDVFNNGEPLCIDGYGEYHEQLWAKADGDAQAFVDAREEKLRSERIRVMNENITRKQLTALHNWSA